MPRWQFVVAGLLLSAPALAETHRLDDLGTYSVPPAPSLQWSAWQTSGKHSVMVGQFELHLRLDVSAWMGRRVRIFMRLPKDQESVLELRWESGRTITGGQVASGRRTLIYSAEIRSPHIEDVVDVHVRSAPDWAGSSRRLDVVFELEGV